MIRKLERYPRRRLSPQGQADLESSGLGARDAAVIMGADPEKSAYTLWAEKAGLLTPESPKVSAQLSESLEDYLTRRFREVSGKETRRISTLVKNPAYPHAYAWLEHLVLGEDAGLTCAALPPQAGGQIHEEKYPRQYYYHCLHQMMISRRNRWYLALLTPGQELRIFPLEVKPAELRALALAESQFWQKVTRKEPPLPDGSISTLRTLERLYPQAGDKSVDLSPISTYVHDYILWRQREQQAAEAARTRAGTIKAFLADSGHGHLGRIQIHWTPVPETRLDTDALKAAHPEVKLERYMKTRRRLQIFSPGQEPLEETMGEQPRK